jgi:glycosyltransferase involved in cell wall biosynthesis
MTIQHKTADLPPSSPLRPLKIAVVTETFSPEVNGVAMTLGKLVDGLLELGHSIQVVRPRQANEVAAPVHDRLVHVLTAGVPLPTYRELRFGLPIKRRLMQLWRVNRPDIIHVATEGPLGRSAVAAAHVLGLPVSSSFHTNFHSYSQHYGIGWLKTLIENYLRRFHNRTLATMVPTRALMNDLQARGYQRLMLLSRGVETRQFTPTKRSQEQRETWGAGPDDLVCLHVGRLAKEKNMDVVIAAFRAIQANHPGAKLVLVGDGPLRSSLASAHPDVIFAGTQQGQTLATHYASGDVFLFPSLTETFGNVVPEALASGLAVVSFANGAALELITTEHNGVLVPMDAETDFVNAAVALANSAKRLQQLRAQAADSVAHLGWAAIHNSFIASIHGLVQQHSRPIAQSAVHLENLPINQPIA